MLLAVLMAVGVSLLYWPAVGMFSYLFLHLSHAISIGLRRAQRVGIDVVFAVALIWFLSKVVFVSAPLPIGVNGSLGNFVGVPGWDSEKFQDLRFHISNPTGNDYKDVVIEIHSNIYLMQAGQTTLVPGVEIVMLSDLPGRDHYLYGPQGRVPVPDGAVINLNHPHWMQVRINTLYPGAQIDLRCIAINFTQVQGSNIGPKLFYRKEPHVTVTTSATYSVFYRPRAAGNAVTLDLD